MKMWNRKMKRFLFFTIGFLILTGCQDRNFTLLGYRFGSNFDPSVRTVAVSIFRNVSEQTSPNRNLEADLAQAIVREINGRPGLRVVSDPAERAAIMPRVAAAWRREDVDIMIAYSPLVEVTIEDAAA